MVTDTSAKMVLPGKMGDLVDDLKAITIKAEMSSSADGIDKGAQALYDNLIGVYGEEVAGKYRLPTMENLVSDGLANAIDWQAADTIRDKVTSYLVLAEDFGLDAAQVEAVNDFISEYESMKPKPRKMGAVKKDGAKPKQQEPDMPFALQVTYKDQEVVETQGVRSGSVYWSNLWSKVKKNHYQKLPGHDDTTQFSDAIIAAAKEAKEKLLENGGGSFQVWDYVVSTDILPTE